MFYRLAIMFMVWAMVNWRYFNTLLQFAFRTNSFIRFSIDLLSGLWYTYIEREREIKMNYLLVFDNVKRLEFEIKTLEQLYDYAHAYKKVEIDFENSTIYISQKK